MDVPSGSQDFVDFIKNRYLTGLKKSRDVPAAGALLNKISIQNISDIVDETIGKEAKEARNIKIFLCQKHTGQKLKTIGSTFGIGDSAVSQVCIRFGKKLEREKQMRKKIRKIEKVIKMSKVET